MDLDKLKENWKKSEISPYIEDEKIYRILDKKGKTALNRLILFEKIGMYILLPLIIIPFLHNHFLPTAPYPKFSVTLFVGFCIMAFFWEIFKINLLKKIDPVKTDILLCSKYITKYKKYIQYELLIGIIWFVIFLLSYIFSFLPNIHPDKLIMYYIIQITIITIAILVIIIAYRLLYKNNIYKIEESLKEIEDFEKDNI